MLSIWATSEMEYRTGSMDSSSKAVWCASMRAEWANQRRLAPSAGLRLPNPKPPAIILVFAGTRLGAVEARVKSAKRGSIASKCGAETNIPASAIPTPKLRTKHVNRRRNASALANLKKRKWAKDHKPPAGKALQADLVSMSRKVSECI